MSYVKPLRSACLLCTVIVLTACASRYRVTQADWEQGAREGRIVRDYALPGTVPIPACMAQMTPQERAGHHFVQVKFNRARHVHFEVAELPSNVQADVGDEVEIWPEDCAAGKFGRIAKVFLSEPN